METAASLFEIFGGIRPMARKANERPSTVMAWKRNGRIPAKKHNHVLEVGLALGLPITPAHVMYPLGIPAHMRMAADIAGHIIPVPCDPHAISQPSNDA